MLEDLQRPLFVGLLPTREKIVLGPSNFIIDRHGRYMDAQVDLYRCLQECLETQPTTLPPLHFSHQLNCRAVPNYRLRRRHGVMPYISFARARILVH